MAALGGLQRVVMPEDVAAPAPAAPRRTKAPLLALFLLLASGLFVARGWDVIPAPFGDSHDGRNAGVWVAGAHALREEGPIRSRLGTRSPEHGTYANHPPLIAVEIAVTEAIGGGSRAATRAPAWLGSLAVIFLLGILLRDRRLRGPMAGAAVLLTVATPMFLVFGTMLDTPVTSLPFGVALLVLWERARAGRRVPRPLAAGAAALAVLAGWQSLLLAGAVAGWASVRRRRGDETAFVAGAVVGATLLAAWLWWAFGGAVRPLVDAYLFRTGQGDQPVSLAELLHRQIGDVKVMFGAAAVLGLLGLVPALARRQTRGLALLALAVTVPYPLVFCTGAVNHEYWDYWFLLPLALGLAAGGDWVVGALNGRRGAERLVAGAGVALAGTMAFAAWANPTPPGWSLRQGVRAGALAERAAAELPSDQRTAWFAGAVGRPASWISLATGRPAVHLSTDDLTRLAAERPGDVVLVGRVRCLAAGEPHIDYSLERPADLVARPTEVGLCASG